MSGRNPSQLSAQPSGLLCILGLVFGLAVTVGGTIAMGILRVPCEVAAQLPSYWPYLAVWTFGGLYALGGAVSVAELAAMFPRSGGPFLLTRQVLGRFPGFVVGWGDWLNWCSTCAALALVIGESTRELLPGFTGWDKQLALGVLLAIFLVQWRGVREGSRLQAWASLIKALAFLALIACCLAVGGASSASVSVTQPRELPGGFGLVVAVILAMQGVMFTYSGWEITTYFGEEVRDPGRIIPRSMIGSTLIVVAIYLLYNWAMLSVLTLPELADSKLKLSAGAAAAKVFGSFGGVLISILALVSILAALLAGALLTPRILYALGREGLFLAQATRVNRGGTPAIALCWSAAASVLILFSGEFDRLLAIMAFLVVANYAMLFLAVFVCRWREPGADRPYRAWGYPWTTALSLLASVLFLVGVVVADPINSLYALALWAIGLLIYPMIYRMSPARGGK